MSVLVRGVNATEMLYIEQQVDLNIGQFYFLSFAQAPLLGGKRSHHSTATLAAREGQ